MTAVTAFLLGIDIGTTTTRFELLRAPLNEHWATKRRTFGAPEVVKASPVQFTPFCKNELDVPMLLQRTTDFLRETGTPQIHGGGVLITGLAARAANVSDLTRLLESTLGETVVIAAADPVFEAWLAYAGSWGDVLGEGLVLNLDIGGGTTNPALARDGKVECGGSYFIGARHFQFVPGTFELTKVSRWGGEVLEGLETVPQPGELLPEETVTLIVSRWVELLEAVVLGDVARLQSFCEAPLPAIPSGAKTVFSGGVGELIYARARGGPRFSRTEFGDLGGELAEAVCRSKILAKDLLTVPHRKVGSATVRGMAEKGTELSGATIFLPNLAPLPLRGIPIVGSVAWDTPGSFGELVSHASSCNAGTALFWRETLSSKTEIDAAVRIMGALLGRLPPGKPVVLLLESNVGKTLGNVLSDWGTGSRALVVLDEINPRSARFLTLGRLLDGTVSVSFYGFV